MQRRNMKTVLTAFALIFATSLSAHAKDMQKYLSDTQSLVRQGKHKEALERYQWFHDHALEHEPAMYGVRLSFALSYWKQLGDAYPPALASLKKTRDDKTTQLLQGKGNAQLFHDVESLNSTLGDDPKTVDLFRKLDDKQKNMAKQCWKMAKDSIIKAKAYDLARKYIGNPVREFTKVKAMYDQNLTLYDNPQIGGDSFKAYNENNLVEESLKLIDDALALDDRKAAKEIQTKALAIIDDYRLNNAIPTETEKKDNAQQKNSRVKK